MVHSQLPVQAASQPAVTQAWMPIETAPHETTVLLYSPAGDFYDAKIETGWACSGRRWRHPSGGISSNMSWHGTATHWMPLPLPPDDRPGASVAQDSCLNQTLIDSAVSTAIERCAKVADEHYETERDPYSKASAAHIATAIRALSTGGKDGK